MRSFAVIGHPLGHTLSPTFHNYLFDRLVLDARYNALNISPHELPVVTQQLRQGHLDGINITLPYKTAFLAHLDEVAPDAAPVGAVNCVTAVQGRLTGHNTDVAGIHFTLQEGGFDAKGTSVLIMGAGGAARAAMAALTQLGTGHICVAARRKGAVESFLNDFRTAIGNTTLDGRLMDPELNTTPYQLLINATPVGMWPKEETSPLKANQLHQGQTVFDLVYHPEETLLIRQATSRGCHVITGLQIFIRQGLASLEHWFPGVIYNDIGTLNPRIEVSTLRAVLLDAIKKRATDPDTAVQAGESAQ
ncbi:MAG: shikimate dehydrogenase [Candidatus Neomarinimicrobiota bacterium]